MSEHPLRPPNGRARPVKAAKSFKILSYFMRTDFTPPKRNHGFVGFHQLASSNPKSAGSANTAKFHPRGLMVLP
ncbi:hypothetical protein D3C81_1781090 [compost metagenome]